jgi:linoleoyl-CoA desaturase
MTNTIRFKNTNGKHFQDLLKQRIETYFRERKSKTHGNMFLILKTIFFMSWMCTSYALLFYKGNNLAAEFALFVIFGLGSAFFIMNVAHDASHHCYSSSKRINKLLSYSWNLVGMSSYMWELKHNSSHHNFTNVIDHDDDISQSGIIRLNPRQTLRWHHRFQYLYAPVAYSLLSLFIVFVKDFRMFGQKRFGNRQVEHPASEWAILILTKAFYISYSLALPMMLLPFSWHEILCCFLGMHIAIGLTITFILAPPHINSLTNYVTTDERGAIHKNWFAHQVETTIDYSAGSFLMAWFAGGLNTHVAHHLYPGISHIHYRKLTPIIRNTAAECGITYINKTFISAVQEHFKFLKVLGHGLPVRHVKH